MDSCFLVQLAPPTAIRSLQVWKAAWSERFRHLLATTSRVSLRCAWRLHTELHCAKVTDKGNGRGRKASRENSQGTLHWNSRREELNYLIQTSSCPWHNSDQKILTPLVHPPLRVFPVHKASALPSFVPILHAVNTSLPLVFR